MDSSFLASEFPDTGPENAGFHIIPVPLERTVSYGAGTCRGPAAILEASQQLEAWDGISSPGILGFHTCEPVNCDQPIDAVFADIMAKVHTALEYGAIRRVVEDCGLPLVQFGTRDYSEEEADFRKKAGITAYDAAFLARKGLPRKPLPKRFPKNVYVTFDVDGLDSSLMPATGTPSPGGLFWNDAMHILATCLKGRRLIGFDVVELAPIESLHHADFTAAKLVHALMGMAQRSKK